MKLRAAAALKLLALSALALVLSPAASSAQTAGGGRVSLESLDRLAPLALKAVKKNDKSEDGKGLVYVREFEFRQAGAYSAADLEPIRAQVKAPGWSRLMLVEDREKGDEETVEIYVYGKADRAKVYGAMVIISAEPRELTVVNIVGDGRVRGMLRKTGGRKPGRGGK
jgi:hypothetical protein